MKILIELETQDTADLAALTALVDSLGGRMAPAVTVDNTVRAAPPAPPAATAPLRPAPASESLIDQEAARASAVDPAARDVNGLPWDARIHAGTGAKNADGSWRGRRGVDAAVVASVTAELKAATAAPTPDAAFEPPSAPVPPPPSGEAPAAQVAAPVAPAPPAAEAPAAPPAADADAITYPKIIKIVGQKGLTYDQLNGVAATFGIPGFKELVGHPELFESFVAALPE